MAYQVYTTSAYVCGSFDRNTSDRHYYLFTREAGMMLASAKSIREERSKHRYALQNFSRVEVSMVRGRQAWKITGTSAEKNLYFTSTDRVRRGVILRVTQLIQRFIRGEERDPELFDYVVTGLEDMLTDTERRPAVYEQIITFKLLHALGYVADDPVISEVIAAPSAKEAYQVASQKEKQERLRSAIDHALYISDL